MQAQPLGHVLFFDRCPHCGIASPSIHRHGEVFDTQQMKTGGRTTWGVYSCRSCGGVITARGARSDEPGLLNLIAETFPPEKTVAAELPDAARHYLMQAFETLSAPDAAVLMAASAVDAMLKEKNLDEGSLNQRIDKAAELRILTPEMAQWAHSVRWESNRPRHADKSNPHLTVAEARQAVEFAEALGEVLFVLPARVSRGLVASQQRNGK